MTKEVTINKITKIVKQLTTENQQYFLTLVRVAAVAENAARKDKNPNERAK